MLQRDTSIRYLKGIGEARAASFASLNLNRAEDLLYFFPRTYENRGDVSRTASASEGEICSLVVTIDSPPSERTSKNGLVYTKTTASDETGSVELVFFNQKWVAKSLATGRVFRVYGRITHGLFGSSMLSPIIEAVYEGKELKDIIPVYPLTRGLTQKIVADAVKQVLPLCEQVKNTLPDSIIKQFGLADISTALRNMHIPADSESLKKARHTLAFEELLVYRLALSRMKSSGTEMKAPLMDYKGTGIAKFFESLSFQLTGAQERVVKEILTDLCKEKPMMRLVQGDVGSGKTVLAAAAIYFTVKNGYQAVMMAPTEILANQHYKTLKELLSPFGIETCLLTSSLKQKEKQEAKKSIADGTIRVAVGTHALIQSNVEYKALGLAVTDEQHRFGVMQRASLVEKGEKERLRAHTLVMSATPIPRTLSLILYGDLEVSLLDEMPPGRQKIETYSVGSDYRDRIYEFIRKQIALGHQAYIICPLVEENEDIPRKAVEAYAETLRSSVFSDIKIGFIHGRLSGKAKEREMREFESGISKVLVSTTVVEVGVDVPNATVMLIENAECFGLSQLHQLRGRIGRGRAKSYCILMSDTKSAKTKERLDIMTRTNDGFEIAEADLKQRGPGDFFGERQSGEISFKCADIADMTLISQTSEAVKMLNDYPENEKEELAEAVEKFLIKTRDGKTFN